VHAASAQGIANDALPLALSCLNATLSDAQILTIAELLSSMPTCPRQGGGAKHLSCTNRVPNSLACKGI